MKFYTIEIFWIENFSRFVTDTIIVLSLPFLCEIVLESACANSASLQCSLCGRF